MPSLALDAKQIKGPQQPEEVGAVRILIFQKRHRDTESFAQDHTAKRQQSQYLNQGQWVAKSKLLMCTKRLTGRGNSVAALRLQRRPRGPSSPRVELMSLLFIVLCLFRVIRQNWALFKSDNSFTLLPQWIFVRNFYYCLRIILLVKICVCSRLQGIHHFNNKYCSFNSLLIRKEDNTTR